MISQGKTVRISYNLTIAGKLVKSVSSVKPLRYVHGRKQIFSGLEQALKGLKVGESKDFSLSPKEGYGLEDPKLRMEMPKSRFQKKDHVIGKQLISQKDGKFFATVRAVRPKTLLLDFNHPFAGKKLRYEVVVVAIEGEGAIHLKKGA